MGLGSEDTGPSFFDLSETDPVERWASFYTSIGNGDYVFREYHYTGDGKTLNEKIVEGDFTVIPIIENYY